MEIQYQLCSDYPIAIEEVALCFLDSEHLVGIGGFNTGAPSSLYGNQFYSKKNRQYFKKLSKKKIKKYLRGFKNQTYLYSIPKNRWIPLSSFPGHPRQGIRAVQYQNQIYAYGGFSYQPASNLKNVSRNLWPQKANFRAFTDGYKLYQDPSTQQYRWEKLPTLPKPLSNFCLAVYQDALYICTGGSHNLKKNYGKLEVEYQDGDRLINIGEDLIKLDLSSNVESHQWHKISEFPGSPRFNAGSVVYQDYWYIFGGIYANPKWTYLKRKRIVRYFSVLDNWRYHFPTNQWERLIDTPMCLGNFGSQQFNIYQNRYVIFLGGAWFHKSITYPRKIRKSRPTRDLFKRRLKKVLAPEECKVRTLVIYDLETNKFQIDEQGCFNFTNLPSYVIQDNDVYILAGEQIPIAIDGNYYGCHSDLFLKGTIK